MCRDTASFGYAQCQAVHLLQATSYRLHHYVQEGILLCMPDIGEAAQGALQLRLAAHEQVHLVSITQVHTLATQDFIARQGSMGTRFDASSLCAGLGM